MIRVEVFHFTNKQNYYKTPSSFNYSKIMADRDGTYISFCNLSSAKEYYLNYLHNIYYHIKYLVDERINKCIHRPFLSLKMLSKPNRVKKIIFVITIGIL